MMNSGFENTYMQFNANYDSSSSSSDEGSDSEPEMDLNELDSEPLGEFVCADEAPVNNLEERDLVKKYKRQEKEAEEGDTWYLINSKWYEAWKDYTEYDRRIPGSDGVMRSKPGPIPNDELLDDENDPTVIKDGLREQQDFNILSPNVWTALYTWYQGGPVIPRRVILARWNELVVEVQPFKLFFYKSSDIKTEIVAHFSKVDTCGHMKTVMCEKLNLDEDQVRIWDWHAQIKQKPLLDPKEKLDEAQIIDDQKMLIEEKLPNGKWPAYENRSRMHVPRAAAPGLQNFGNTCFMNSALQCLSNTAPLANFFVSDKYEEDLNSDNPLGTGGELANEFATLMKDIWSGDMASVTPREFKWKLGRYAPQFDGYQQHDSQELLAFLLDGLHEDLNRVKEKPYVESKESDGRPDEEVAIEAWEGHTARNNSIIVDWFQGQLKSTLVCPECDKVSVTFDPFMYLGLPLPSQKTRNIVIKVVFKDFNILPVKYLVPGPKHGNMRELNKAVADISGSLNAENIQICDVYNSRFFKKYADNTGIDIIQDRDVIVAYELDSVSENTGDDSDLIHLSVYMRREEIQYHQYLGQTKKQNLFGLPFLITVPKNITYSKLYDHIMKKLERYITMPEPPEPTSEVKDSTEDQDMKDTKIEEEEEKKKENTNNNENENNTNNNNENEEEDDDMIKKEEKSTDSSTSTSESDSDDDDIEDFERPFFIIRACDGQGTTDLIDFLRRFDKDEPLGLNDRQNLVLVWDTKMYQKYYKQEEESKHVKDASLTTLTQDEDVTLEDCLDLFTETETLSEEDPWYCNKCKEFRCATKKFDLWKLPKILVVHLKRFSYKRQYWREKLETLVDFPLAGLDLNGRVLSNEGDSKPIYDLYAVSNHFGALGGGHYTAFSKNKNNKNWYRFDDSSVSTTNESNVKSSAAYVLFYRRVDTMDDEIDGVDKEAVPTNGMVDSDSAESSSSDTEPED